MEQKQCIRPEDKSQTPLVQSEEIKKMYTEKVFHTKRRMRHQRLWHRDSAWGVNSNASQLQGFIHEKPI